MARAWCLPQKWCWEAGERVGVGGGAGQHPDPLRGDRTPSSAAPGVRFSQGYGSKRGRDLHCLNIQLKTKPNNQTQQRAAPGQMAALLGILLKCIFNMRFPTLINHLCAWEVFAFGGSQIKQRDEAAGRGRCERRAWGGCPVGEMRMGDPSAFPFLLLFVPGSSRLPRERWALR